MNLFSSLTNNEIVNQAVNGLYPALCLTLAVMVIVLIWQRKHEIPVKIQLIYGAVALVIVMATFVLYSQNLLYILLIAVGVACVIKLAHLGLTHYLKKKAK